MDAKHVARRGGERSLGRRTSVETSSRTRTRRRRGSGIVAKGHPRRTSWCTCLRKHRQVFRRKRVRRTSNSIPTHPRFKRRLDGYEANGASSPLRWVLHMGMDCGRATSTPHGIHAPRRVRDANSTMPRHECTRRRRSDGIDIRISGTQATRVHHWWDHHRPFPLHLPFDSLPPRTAKRQQESRSKHGPSS